VTKHIEKKLTKTLVPLTPEQDFLMKVLWRVGTRREDTKRWRKNNPERFRESVRKRIAADPERFRELNRAPSREYHRRNKEKDRARYLANRAFRIKQNAEYLKANPEQHTVKNSKRKARELGNGGSFTAQQWIDLKLFYGNKCLCCHRKEHVLVSLGLHLSPDHVISLAKGGSNDISNIQPLCHGLDGCNNKKGSKCTDYRPAADSKLSRKT
jgi:hypothetical protein